MLQMQELKELIEEGEKLRNKLSKLHFNTITINLKGDVLLWVNQCALYIDGIKMSKFTQGRIYTAIANLEHQPGNLHYFDILLDFLKANLSQTSKKDKLNVEESLQKSNQIFIVHGHNEALIDKVKTVLYSLKLEPIVLSEQINGGKTIIEKFEENSDKVKFAIILVTADDVGKGVKEKKLKPRARQNVILEMGYFMASLKRSNVFLLLEDQIEIPSDINGVGYASINDKWEMMLVKELQHCGYKVTADDLR